MLTGSAPSILIEPDSNTSTLSCVKVTHDDKNGDYYHDDYYDYSGDEDDDNDDGASFDRCSLWLLAYFCCTVPPILRSVRHLKQKKLLCNMLRSSLSFDLG